MPPNAGLAAATDDPVQIAERAISDLKRSIRKQNRDGLRQAVEMAWLAACSGADVAAVVVGGDVRKGSAARREVLASLERRAQVRAGVLVGRFEMARLALHRECFEGDRCLPDAQLLGLLLEVRELVDDVGEALRIAKKEHDDAQ